MRVLFHPLVVHFPVALWLTSFVFDLLFMKTRQRFFATASSYLMGLGLLSAGVSIALGFVDYIPLVAEGVGQAFIDRHRTHSYLAYAATITYGGIFLARWRWRVMPPVLYVSTAAVAAVLIALTAWFGGEIRRVM